MQVMGSIPISPTMTDSNLMDANCIHGEVWYECKTCEKEMNEILEKLENEENEQENRPWYL